MDFTRSAGLRKEGKQILEAPFSSSTLHNGSLYEHYIRPWGYAAAGPMRLSSTNLSCQLSASAKSLKALRRRGGKRAAPTIHTRRIKVADQAADATDQACCREGLQPGSRAAGQRASTV